MQSKKWDDDTQIIWDYNHFVVARDSASLSNKIFLLVILLVVCCLSAIVILVIYLLFCEYVTTSNYWALMLAIFFVLLMLPAVGWIVVLHNTIFAFRAQIILKNNKEIYKLKVGYIEISRELHQDDSIVIKKVFSRGDWGFSAYIKRNKRINYLLILPVMPIIESRVYSNTKIVKIKAKEFQDILYKSCNLFIINEWDV